jgi:hypothetical protein
MKESRDQLTREEMLSHPVRSKYPNMAADVFCENFDSILRGFGSMKKGKKKSPSNELTSAVINYVKLKGGVARRVNTSGQFDESTGKWRPSGMRRGFEDVSCVLSPNGKYLAVEIKIGKDKLSEYQIERQQELERVGAVYYVAKNFDDFKLFFDKLNQK